MADENGYEPPEVSRDETGGGCNFCTRGTLDDNTRYPVTVFKRSISGGLQARICDLCLGHVTGRRLARNLP